MRGHYNRHTGKTAGRTPRLRAVDVQHVESLSEHDPPQLRGRVDVRGQASSPRLAMDRRRLVASRQTTTPRTHRGSSNGIARGPLPPRKSPMTIFVPPPVGETGSDRGAGRM
jgi:hypothetical protein